MVILQTVLVELVSNCRLAHAKGLVNHLEGQFELSVLPHQRLAVFNNHVLPIVSLVGRVTVLLALLVVYLSQGALIQSQNFLDLNMVQEVSSEVILLQLFSFVEGN